MADDYKFPVFSSHFLIGKVSCILCMEWFVWFVLFLSDDHLGMADMVMAVVVGCSVSNANHAATTLLLSRTVTLHNRKLTKYQ